MKDSDVDEDYINSFVKECREICDMAEGITIIFECHGNTLTDDAEFAINLYKMIDKPNLKHYWQPEFKKSFASLIET